MVNLGGVFENQLRFEFQRHFVQIIHLLLYLKRKLLRGVQKVCVWPDHGGADIQGSFNV